MIFMIFYKSLWVIAVAYPLWRAGALAGSPAEEMAHIFVWGSGGGPHRALGICI